MNILEIKNLTKKFKNEQVLKNISFSMGKGEVLAIIGSSGSGKTTLLRILNGLDKADSGSVTFNGETALESRSNRTRKLGLVFQSFNLFPHINLQNNVMLAVRKCRKKSKADALAICVKSLELVGLTGNEKKYPAQLSGGMQQRGAIARALALEPQILCFDEPTSALDPELTNEVLKVIKDLKEQGKTMIIVTHEMTFARDVADNILFMDNGVIAEYGNSKELFTSPKTQRLKDFLSKKE